MAETYVTLREDRQPFDEVEIAATGQIVKRGTSVAVPSAIAGREPRGKPGDADYHPGDGLLAQSDMWSPANKGQKKREPEAAPTEEG